MPANGLEDPCGQKSVSAVPPNKLGPLT